MASMSRSQSDQVSKAIELFLGGMNQCQAAKAAGVTVSALHRARKRAGMDKLPPGRPKRVELVKYEFTERLETQAALQAITDASQAETKCANTPSQS